MVMKPFLVAAALTLVAAVVGYGSPVMAAVNCTGPTIDMGGNTNVAFEDETPVNNATYDGSSFRSTAPFSATSDHAVKLGGQTVVSKLCVVGPVVDGSFSYSLTWREMHDDIGGYGLQLFSNDIQAEDMRIDNVEDGFKMQNCAEDDGVTDCDAQKPGGKWSVNGVYMTGIRDDSIDNDDCMPGDVTNSLFDGVHTFLSEQEESASTGACVSGGEDSTIGISDSIVRLYQTNAFDPGEDEFPGPGKWFKWQGDTTHHTVVVKNVTFAVDEQPRSGWDNLDFPGTGGNPGATFWVANSGNTILYLGDDTYGGPRPPNVAFQTGSQARATYQTRRNAMLTALGYDTRPAGDLNPLDDPVVRHGAK